MTPRSNDPTSHAVDVDWDDPELRELLKKTEGLRLDNRGTFHARRVRVHLGWHLQDGSSAWQPALLVWEDNQSTLVLQTRTLLFRPGDPVAVDKTPEGPVNRVVFGEVVQSHVGLRPEDQKQEVFLAWVNVLKK